MRPMDDSGRCASPPGRSRPKPRAIELPQPHIANMSAQNGSHPPDQIEKAARVKSSSDRREWRKSKYVGLDSSLFQQTGALQGRQIILLHFCKRPAGDGIPRDQNNFNGLGQFMLMLPETFPQQTARTIALHSTADFFTRDHAQFWLRPVRQSLPVGNETTEYDPLPLLPDAREMAARPDARGAAQTFRWFGGRGHAKSNRRQAFAAVAAAVGQRGLAALAGIAIEKSMLAFATDFRRLILAFHKLGRARARKNSVLRSGEVSSESACVKAWLPLREARLSVRSRSCRAGIRCCSCVS